MHQEFSVTIAPLTAYVSAQGVPPLIGDRYQKPHGEAESPIDLPLHEAEPVATQEPPMFRQVSEAPAETSRGLGIAMGMLVIGLLAGFGGGFLVGQRMVPPALPRAIEIQPPVPAVPPVSETAPPPIAASEPPVLPAQNYTGPPVVDVPPVEIGEPRGPDKVRATGEISLVSRPAGATVYVDDVRVGVTPMVMRDVGPGMHRIRIELFGHRTWVTSVTVEPGAQVRVGASLEEGG